MLLCDSNTRTPHMTQHHQDDSNYIATAESWTPSPVRVVTPHVDSTPPRFANISPNLVLRADAPGLAIDTVVGSYRIVKQIGVGGMATVFEAVHLMLARRVAIKVMHPQLRENSGMDIRMVQEAAILDQVNHAGVARIFDCGVLPDGRPWIAMELVPGESLAAKLARDIKLSTSEVCNLVAAVADVLATVHARNIVHRDLKPENILFADADSGFPLRVIDWGVAHLQLDTRLTLDGVTCGTPVYMSPEQAVGREIAPACDIYSLGVIAYEALAGVAPFEARTLAEVMALHDHGEAAPLAELCSAAPRALCELIHLMLHKTASRRPCAADVRREMQWIALAILDDNAEFASYAITTRPCADDDSDDSVEFASYAITTAASAQDDGLEAVITRRMKSRA
jgi:eukaryotic-like serine/threonine-protein kinase